MQSNLLAPLEAAKAAPSASETSWIIMHMVYMHVYTYMYIHIEDMGAIYK